MIEEAIGKLSNVLSLLSERDYDKSAIRSLIKGIVDEKHLSYVEKGLSLGDKSMIMHGIMGALSHYEAEKEKESLNKKIHSLHEHH